MMVASVAERTSYFFLARKLIWSLSRHTFSPNEDDLSYSVRIVFLDNKKWWKPAKHNLPQNLWRTTNALSVRSFHSSRSTISWEKPSSLWTSWVYSLRPRVPRWTRIRCLESATHSNTFMSPLTFAMFTATRKITQTFSNIIPEQHYLETFMALPYSNQDHTFMGDYIIPVLKQQTQPFASPMAMHNFAQTFNNALTVATHILLSHLAAKIPSQLHNCFLPSYETSSIKVPFIMATIKLS